MSFQIRSAIHQNMANHTQVQIKEVVEDAIARGEEHLLPGLGVFFETWWNVAGDSEKNTVLSKLESQFKQ